MKFGSTHGGSPGIFSVACLLGATIVPVVGADAANAKETRAYAIYDFVQATNNEDGDCPGGPNPDAAGMYKQHLVQIFGKSKEEAERLIAAYIEGKQPEANEVNQLMANRGRVNGKPVNPFTNPATAPDPMLKSVTSKFAYGFNLDGKDGAGNFIDPMTREGGVDHAFARATGCTLGYRGTLDQPSTYWTYNYQVVHASPAWLVEITGDDLTNGEVEVVFSRALDHARITSANTPQFYATYRVDTDPRSRNVLRGKMKNGALESLGQGDIHLLWSPLAMPDLNLNQARFRATPKSDGSMHMMLGGYQPWEQLYWGCAEGGYSKEGIVCGDIPGLYYQLRRWADAEPDAKTGQHMAISITYHFTMVPAFTLRDQP